MKNLRSKLTRSTIAILKVSPIVGEIVSVLDDLNEIWHDQPDVIEMVQNLEADMIHNITHIISERDKAIAIGVDELSNLLTESSASIEGLRGDVNNIKAALSGISLTTQSVGVSTIILNSWLSLGLRQQALPEDFFFAIRQLSDLDFRIVLYFHERARYWQQGGHLNKNFIGEFPSYHAREIAFSLAKLCSFGFMRAGESLETRPWLERDWEPDLHEIDELCNQLRILPTIAAMPSERYAGIERMSQQGELKLYIESLLQRQSPVTKLMMSAVRRHPFHGYQWQAILFKDIDGPFSSTEYDGWKGIDWQYKTCDDAIKDANECLHKNGQVTTWYYLSA